MIRWFRWRLFLWKIRHCSHLHTGEDYVQYGDDWVWYATWCRDCDQEWQATERGVVVRYET